MQGHVDTIAEVLETRQDGEAKVFRLQPRDRGTLAYVVEKGYVTLDGASLTVTAVEDGEDGWLEVMLIAYTQEKVVMGKKGKGDYVNLEVDIVGKYVEKSVKGYFEGTAGGGDIAVLEKMVERLVDAKLGKKA